MLNVPLIPISSSYSPTPTKQTIYSLEDIWLRWRCEIPLERSARELAVSRLRDSQHKQAISLDLSDLGLSSLPELPTSLQELIISGNKLTILPTLPPSLLVLKAANNLLTTLPELPPTLRLLDVANNQLMTLPELPAQLRLLNVTQNQLTELPESITDMVSNSVVYAGKNPLPTQVLQHLKHITVELGYLGPKMVLTT